MLNRKTVRRLATALLGMDLLGAAAAQTIDGSASSAGDLDRLVAEAQQRNPELQAARRNYDSKKAMEPAASTPPDPMVRFESMGNLLPLSLQRGDPSSGRILSFTQEIPFPGKLRLRGRMASDETRAEWWSYERLRRQIATEVKSLYYRLWLIRQNLEALKQDKDLLEKIAEIAAARYQVGEGSQQDVIQAQLEIARLLEREAEFQKEREVAGSALNALLFRNGPRPPPEAGPVEPSPFEATLEEVSRLALENSPEIRMQRSVIDRDQRAMELARKELYPDFEGGFSYINRDDMPEMFGWMVGARIPLYFWRKQRPEFNAAAAALSASEKRYLSIESRIESETRQLFVEVQTADRLLELYGKGIIPQAALALESATAGYQTGSAEFVTLLDGLRILLESQLKFHENLANRQTSLAQLEFHTGVQWVR